MSPEPITPPSAEQQGENQSIVASSSPPTHEIQTPVSTAPHVRFSFWHWSTTGVVRVLYRAWTRVAARLFPEGSRGEHLAQILHLPLPDKLNMSWVNGHLAVGGRIRLEDIRALSLVGVTHVIDTRSEYCDD